MTKMSALKITRYFLAERDIFRAERNTYWTFLARQVAERKSPKLRRLPTVKPVFGYLDNTSALMHMSHFFQHAMKI